MPWIDVQPIRTVNIPGFLGDIESHLKAGHPYKDRDLITWAHEGTHGINSNIRNGYSRYGVAYVLHNTAFVSPEPDFKLSVVADAVPLHLRGISYNLYLISQQRYWNDQPLYILDELSAYLNGTKVGVEQHVRQRRIEFSFSKTLEFFGYSLILREIMGTEKIDELLSHVNNYIIYMLTTFPNTKSQYDEMKEYVPLWY